MKLDEAIYHAYKAHDGVLDKAGEPYIKHPLRVMRRVMADPDKLMRPQWSFVDKHGSNGQDVCVVAVLHDVLEDTAYIIAPHLNPVQSEAMGYITRHFAEFEGETYKEYIARCCQNEIARIVKWYDLQDNLDPIRMSYLEGGEQKGMTKRYKWSLDYIEELS